MIADIAIILHWPPSELLQMDLADLLLWHRLAVDRWNHIHEVKP
ncbi:GpE family phage tail protein [Croceicoccus estronivorus]|nr:GpE family phage tail protein [Croceicoccus estronivorus]